MAEKKRATKKTSKPAQRTSASDKSSSVFTEEERAAMREYAKERKSAARRSGKDADAEAEKEVLAKIAEMPPADRKIAERIHAIVKANAPEMASRTWYGMPAYTLNGNVVLFFQGGYKFKARYGTLGFSDKAKLDDGNMWPSSFAITELTPVEEARIAVLVKRAVGGNS